MSLCTCVLRQTHQLLNNLFMLIYFEKIMFAVRGCAFYISVQRTVDPYLLFVTTAVEVYVLCAFTLELTST